MSQKHSLVCSNSKCARSFTEPIEISLIQVDGSVENYYACPHCFSRMNPENKMLEGTEAPPTIDKTKQSPSEVYVSSVSKKGQEKSTNDIQKTKPAGCAHFLGYLKKRPKNTPIPDDCLLCVAVMKCM
jgi:hypothetical protein